MKSAHLELVVRQLIHGIDRGLGTAVAETRRATTGEEANRAAIRGLVGVQTAIKEIKKLLDKIDNGGVP